MSGPNDGGPAFPRDHRHNGHNGMSLRDYFAAKAMAAILGLGDQIEARDGEVANEDLYALQAYALADAMLAARCAS